MTLVTSVLSGGTISPLGCWGTGKLSAGPQCGQTLALGLLACWSFTSHSAGGWSRMHFCLVQLQEELCCGSPRQGWRSISISAAAGGFPEVGALPSPWASAAQGAQHVPPHGPLRGGDVQVNEQNDCNKSVWGGLLHCTYGWCRCGAVPCEGSTARLWGAQPLQQGRGCAAHKDHQVWV